MLGWDVDAWNLGLGMASWDRPFREWHKLEGHEREAAETLGFDEELWDEGAHYVRALDLTNELRKIGALGTPARVEPKPARLEPCRALSSALCTRAPLSLRLGP